MSKVCLSWVDPVSRLQHCERFDLPLLIGRAAGNDLILPDPDVARRHVLVREQHNQIVVNDLGSPSGTWVAGQRVEQVLIHDDTVVRLGATTFTAALEAPANLRAPTIALDDPLDQLVDDGTGTAQPFAVWSKGRITHLATSPDGRLFAIGSTLGIQLHDAHTFGERQSIQIERPIDRVVLANDGSVFACAAADVIEYWHIQPDHTQHELIAREHVAANFAVAPDGMTLAIDLGEAVQLMRLDGSAPGHTLAIDTVGLEGCLAFSPDGQILAAAVQAGVQIWSVSSGSLLGRLGSGTDEVRRMAFSPDGALLAVAVADAIMIWDVRSGKLLHTLDGLKRRCLRLIFDQDGRTIAAAMAGAVSIWRVSDGMLLRSVRPGEQVIDIAFGPAGETLMTAGVTGVSFWRIRDGALIHAIDGYQGSVDALAFAPNGRTLASAGDALKLWQIRDGALAQTLQAHGDYVKDIAFSPDGQRIATTLSDRIRLWQIDDGTPARALRERSTESTSAAFSADGKMLVSIGAQAVESWNIDADSVSQCSGEQLPSAGAAEIAVAAGLCASAEENIVRVRRLADGQLIAEFDSRTAVTCLALSPDGQYLAIGADAAVQVWLIGEGEQLYSLDTGASRLIFSQDGSALATLHGNLPQLWQVSQGIPLSTLAGHTDTVNALAFAPSGHLAASGSSDGTVRLWRY